MDINYLKRVFQAYLGSGKSQLTFWHETPALNEKAFLPKSKRFYMTFAEKARYGGPFNEQGIPLLDYRGVIGPQLNPIAIAQYGLGCWNLHLDETNKNSEWRNKYLQVADWLVLNLVPNQAGISVWMHHFDWEYFQKLKSPWYSGLAQGQGIALLMRAWWDTGDIKYLNAADKAFVALITPVSKGGTLFIDEKDNWWIEEYITDPPTHILNGFFWALWGVWDYAGESKSAYKDKALELWNKSLITLAANLERFDTGHWSVYDLSSIPMRNPASPFYHRLHLVQLQVMHRLSGQAIFRDIYEKWLGYQQCFWCRNRALIEKAIFKLRYF